VEVVLTSALENLVCPATGASLSIEPTNVADDDVLEGSLDADGVAYPIREGIPSFVAETVAEDQTVRSFAQKWIKHNYYREHTRQFYTDWYLERYDLGDHSGLSRLLEGAEFVLDAGTGTGRDAVNFLESSAATIYAVDTAWEALALCRREVPEPRLALVHADVMRLPFPDEFFDFINCDQVIHHTADPRATFDGLRKKLKTNGQICCYVYRKKGAVREFTDDFVRERISDLPIDQALETCEGITRLGRTLANLDVTVEVEQDIPILGIAKGSIDLQRFFHWNFMKCFWNEDFDFFTNNIVNFDWYHPRNCFRFEPDEFRAWFAEGWEVQSWDVREAGISCRAVKI
jgi:SAM-dependent methyltransferase